jgi:hypothetical protein
MRIRYHYLYLRFFLSIDFPRPTLAGRLTVDGVAGRITLAQLQGYFPPGRSPTLRPDTAVVEAR